MQEHAQPQVPPVDALVVTVGGSPVPVLLVLAALRPAHAVALVTQASQPVWERVVEAADRLIGWSGTKETVTVVNHDPVSTVEALAQLEDAGLRDWSLAYAGGTPTMSAMSFARWKAGAGLGLRPGTGGPRAWYVAEAGDLLVSHDDVRLEQANVLGPVTLPLHEMVALHGLHADGFDAAPQRWQPVPGDTDPVEVSRVLGGLPVFGASHDRDSLDSSLVEAAAGAVARLVADHPSTSVYRPVKASRPDGRQLEDPHGLAVVTGMSVRVLSVAGFARPWPDKPMLLRRRQVSDLKEQLFGAFDVARGFGGLHARAAVLGTDTSPSAQDEVRTIWADIGPLSRPDDLSDPGRDQDPPWPPMTAFCWADLLEAVEQVSSPDDLHGTDLYRWLTEV